MIRQEQDRQMPNRRAGGIGPWLKRQWTARPKPLWLVCLLHVAVLGIALVLYALPHHVIPHGESAIGVVSTRGVAPRSAPVAAAPTEAPEMDDGEPETEQEAADEATAQPAATDAPAVAAASVDGVDLDALFSAEEVGSFRRKFADMFTDGSVERSTDSYRSGNLCITLKQKYAEEVRARVYVADIYVADISCLTTAFSKDTYGRGYTEWIEDVAKRYQSVVTMNGDYYGSRSTGVIIRNGVLYRDRKARGDICVLYWDGHMEAIKSSFFNAEDEMANGAYQSWSFGPSLLDIDGQPLQHFNCNDYLIQKNPRSCIGYYEPGHYCFVAVDGRNDESRGAGMMELAKLMSALGCKLAYNLDGGQTSLMCVGSKLYNQPSQGGRNSSDYIMVVDSVT